MEKKEEWYRMRERKKEGNGGRKRIKRATEEKGSSKKKKRKIENRGIRRKDEMGENRKVEKDRREDEREYGSGERWKGEGRKLISNGSLTKMATNGQDKRENEVKLYIEL